MPSDKAVEGWDSKPLLIHHCNTHSTQVTGLKKSLLVECTGLKFPLFLEAEDTAELMLEWAQG